MKAVKDALTPAAKLIVLSNLHNPTSQLTDEATMRELGKLGVRVLVDEVYLDAAFEQAPPSAAFMGDQFIVTSSLTKVYGLSGLRCGWIIAEPALAERMWRINDVFGNIPPDMAENGERGCAGRAASHFEISTGEAGCESRGAVEIPR